MVKNPVTGGTALSAESKEIATLGGGCFWCIEEIFRHLKGVEQVTSGYAGGHTKNPTYEEVCEGNTGHAEVVQIVFDPRTITFEEILEVFFSVHDPTTLNRQGDDIGPQYRSIILYHSPEQEQTARQVIKRFEADGPWKDPIVTELKPFDTFYPAEDYHHRFFELNPFQPYCRIVIAPKVANFRRRFAQKLRA